MGGNSKVAAFVKFRNTEVGLLMSKGVRRWHRRLAQAIPTIACKSSAQPTCMFGGIRCSQFLTQFWLMQIRGTLGQSSEQLKTWWANCWAEVQYDLASSWAEVQYDLGGGIPLGNTATEHGQMAAFHTSDCVLNPCNVHTDHS
jgi:hypothetical protein